MNKSTESHLENITVENLLDWQKELFTVFASTSLKAQLGIKGNGNYLVKTHNGEKFVFVQPFDAIQKYTEIISK